MRLAVNSSDIGEGVAKLYKGMVNAVFISSSQRKLGSRGIEPLRCQLSLA
jgi:hypothetical protein